jgi:hypothetical protein
MEETQTINGILYIFSQYVILGESLWEFLSLLTVTFWSTYVKERSLTISKDNENKSRTAVNSLLQKDKKFSKFWRTDLNP